jgi:hypothetical protein
MALMSSHREALLLKVFPLIAIFTICSSAAPISTAFAGASAGKPGTLSFSSSDYGATQNLGVKITTVIRAGGFSGAVSVLCRTYNNTAAAGSQYTAVSRVLTWESGDAMPKNCDVPISNAKPFYGMKTFYVELSNATGAALGTLKKTKVTIYGSARRGMLSFSSANYEAVQKLGTKIIYVNRTGGSGGAASVLCKTYNNTAVAGRQYTAVSHVLTWANGDATTKTCDVPINNAAPFSGSKTFYVELFDAAGAVLGTLTKTAVTINGSAVTASAVRPNGAIVLSWSRPMLDTRGERITNLAGYKIHYGNSPGAMNRILTINSAVSLEYEIGNLPAGTWYFAISAYTSDDEESELSSIVSGRI